jgi:ligand-binding sensor domain-containing protein
MKPFILLLLLSPFIINAQLPTFEWRTHLNYSEAKGVCAIENTIFCFTNNAFFSFHKITKKHTFLEKKNGFESKNPTAIAYNDFTKKMYVGYQDGTIQAVATANGETFESIETNQEITETTAIQGSKQINKIIFEDKTTFLATDFGLVELQENQIKDTYRFIGNSGNPVSVKDVLIKNDTIYIKTTDTETLRASLKKGNNLSYFGNWEKSNPNIFSEEIFEFGSFQTTQNKFVIDNEKYVWIANENAGLISNFEGEFQSYSPNGPLDTSGKLFTDGKKIAFVGTFYNIFENNSWSISEEEKSQNLVPLIDTFGNEWIVSGSFLRVKNATKNYFYSTQDGLSGTPISIAIDASGYIWVGTTNGVSVIASSSDITTRPTQAFRPTFGNQRLLAQQNVQSIAIDSGNRKWFGTTNGLYIFNAETDEELHHFTDKNSPLLSNIIQEIVLLTSGEAFILTSKGLVSYQSDVSIASETMNNVLVFPNPVRPEFNGVLTFQNLPENSTLKIVDLAGNVQATLTTNGGTATWNLQNNASQRVKSGVYISLAVSENTKEHFVSKIAILTNE